MAPATAALQEPDPLAHLARATGAEWPAVEQCRKDSNEEVARIREVLLREKLTPSDCSFIVFGSLARGEFAPSSSEPSPGSDVDWTLLVDGAADPQHFIVAQRLAGELEALGLKSPGSGALFGGLAFSHELVHWIGGNGDSNANLTRRILLLLESRGLVADDGVRERVLRCILGRYLQEDRGYHEAHEYDVRVPRFLLNDIARFWRTMAVDYAAKRRERAGKGWAIRIVKLRLSRKLIFVSGLAMCLERELRSNVTANTTEREFHADLLEFFLQQIELSPLQRIARFGLEFDAADVTARLIERYDEFLAILRDPDKRTRLEAMDLDESLSCPIFNEARDIGSAFQESLSQLFFEASPALARATQRYGVF